MAVENVEILAKMGLTKDELSGLQAKLSNLVRSLDAAQLAAFQSTIPTPEAAAATLGPDVTPEELLSFIRAHSPDDGTVVVCFNGLGQGSGGAVQGASNSSS